MHRFAIALLCCALPSWSQAQHRAPDGATAAVEAYSRALMAADCPGLAARSAVLARHPEATDDFCRVVREWRRSGLHERLRQPTASRSSGAYRMVVVPNRRIVSIGGRPQIGDGVYVAVSHDAGRSWQVIDIGCEQLPKWVKGLYPPYDGHPSFSQATVDRPPSTN